MEASQRAGSSADRGTIRALDRFLAEWFTRIRQRQISLPRFQRMEAWGPNQVAGLLQTVLRGLPAGASLILEVGDSLPFVSRTMVDAPTEGERITELLLDGQQRLTALWRSLNEKYVDRTYLIWFEDDPHNPGEKQPAVYGQPRWMKGSDRYPLWVDKPSSCWGKGYIPARLLRPEDIADEVDEWIESVAGEDRDAEKTLRRSIQGLRDRVRAFNLPYLSLPVRTPKDVALDVFIKMNTSAVRLSMFDILVAQVEAKTGTSLHDFVRRIHEKAPHACKYTELDDLVLATAALGQDRVPNQAGITGLDLERLVTEWDRIGQGLEWMTEFLREEGVLDAQRLPTDAVLAVVAALHPLLPTKPDALGAARSLLRKYLWRAFFTERYEQSSATGALQDFRALRTALADGAPSPAVPIFDEQQFPLASLDELIQAGWPKGRSILSRAILCASLRAGGHDIADETPASRENLAAREYHHLFPAAFLRDGGLAESDASVALNCALISWRTNRTIAAKAPIAYLRERVDAMKLGESELRRRLRSHLIPYDSLAIGGNAANGSLPDAYRAFLQGRARVIDNAMRQLCAGRALELDAVGL